MTYLDEIKLTLEQRGLGVMKNENSLIVKNQEVTVDQQIIKLDGIVVDDIESLIEILSN